MTDERPEGARVTLDMVGSTSAPMPFEWTARDVMLYALAVGAGIDDPGRELQFTTENSAGKVLQVLPAFLTTMTMQCKPPAFARLDRSRMLHADQSFELERPLPATGRGYIEATLEEVVDKGKNAICFNVATLRSADDGAVLGRARAGVFIRGGGGFGGPAASAAAADLPDRPANFTVTSPTRPEQALYYRLLGDDNPLHSDPVAANAVGFERPILHGLCTFGLASRVMANVLGGGDAERVTGMSGQFRKPVYPGETLVTEIWQGEDGMASFRILDSKGEVTFDRGQVRIRG